MRRPRVGLPIAPFLGVFAAICLLSGCKCDDDHPYIPFKVTGATSADSLTPPPAGSGVDPQITTEELSEGRKRWPIFGQEYEAPPGLLLVGAALIKWPASEGKPEKLQHLLVYGPAPGEAAGPLAPGAYLVDPAAPREAPLLFAGLPGSLARPQDARLKVGLRAVGSALQLLYAVRSAEPLPPEQDERSLLLVQLDHPGKPDFELDFRPQQPGEEISGELSAPDLDQDGSPDIELKLRLDGPEPGSRAELKVDWLRRPAGLSRLPDTPLRNWQEAAQELGHKAQRKAERAQVSSLVAASRRLYSALCSEPKTRKLSFATGADGLCSGTEKLGYLWTLAELKAALGENQELHALGIFERADWYVSAASEEQKTNLRRLLEKKLKQLKTAQLRRLPLELTGAQRFDFLSPTELLALGAEGRQQLLKLGLPTLAPTPSAPDESAAAVLPPPSPDPSLGPDGRRLSSISSSCARNELEAVFTPESSWPTTPMRVLAPRPGDCEALSKKPLEFRTAAWEAGLPVFWAAGELQTLSPEFPELSKTVVFPSSFGWVSVHGSQVEVWTAPTGRELPHLSGASYCAASPDGKQLACLGGAELWLLERAAESAGKK